MEFRATIERGGTTATGVEVPAEVVSGLGSGKRPKVRVTINGYTYRSSVASMGGRFMLGISADVREHADVAAGDVVDLNVELDTDPREVTVPADLQQALATDAHARTVFEGLSYSRKQRHVLSIEGAKTDETRQRRIGKAIAELREGKG
jgi:hypothetical protein